MSKTFTKSRNLKQKAVKSLEPRLATIKKNLNAKMSYIDYSPICTIFLITIDKNIFKVESTQSKKL